VKKLKVRKLEVRKITLGKLSEAEGGLRGTYNANCSTSCNTCQDLDACGADTQYFCEGSPEKIQADQLAAAGCCCGSSSSSSCCGSCGATEE
jgi:hypothetical protein